MIRTPRILRRRTSPRTPEVEYLEVRQMLTGEVTRLTFEPVAQIAHHESGNVTSLSPDGDTIGYRDFGGNWQLFDLDTGTTQQGPLAGRQLFFHENQPVEIVRTGGFFVLRRFEDQQILVTLPEIEVPGAIWFDWRIMPSANNNLTDWVWFEQIDSTLNNWSVVRANLQTGSVEVARVSDLTGELNPVRASFRHHDAFWDGDRAYIIHNARGPGFDTSDWVNEFWEVTTDGVSISHAGWSHPTINQGDWAYNFWNAQDNQFEVRFSGSRPTIVFPGWGPNGNPAEREAANHHFLLDGYLVSSVEEQMDDGFLHQVGVQVYDPNNVPIAFWEVTHQAGPVPFAAALARPFLGYTDVGLTAFWHSDADNVAGAVDLYAASVFDEGTLGPYSATDPGGGDNGGGDNGGGDGGDNGGGEDGGGDTGSGDPPAPEDVFVLEGESASQVGNLNVPDPANAPLVASVGTIENNLDGTWTWTLEGPLFLEDSQTVYITIPGSTGSVTTFELVVANAGPTVDFGQPPIVSVGATLNRTLFASDLGFETLEATINYGDGSPEEVVLADPVTGAFEISHAYQQTGNYPLSIRLDDGRGGISNQSTIVRVTPPEIDIEVTQSASTNLAFSGTGDMPVLTITATNVGLLDATGVVIEDTLTLPNGVTIDSVDPGPGSWADPFWTIGDLATGDSASLSVTLAIDGTATSEVDGISSVANFSTANETEVNPDNDTAAASITIVDNGIDVGLAVQESSAIVEPGTGPGNHTYTLTATNHGNSLATAVIIENTLNLPPGVAIESIDSNTPLIGGISNWWVGNLAPGASEVLSVTLTVDETAQPADDAISLESAIAFVAEADLIPENDQVLETTSIAVPVDIELMQTQSSNAVIAQVDGGELVYTITARNLRSEDATEIQIEEVLSLPPGVEVQSVEPSAGTWNDPLWELDSIPGESSETLKVTLSASPDAPIGMDLIISTATVLSVKEPDANTDNDFVSSIASIVAPTVDIAIDQTATTIATGIEGADQLVFQIHATNNGPATASEISIKEEIDAPPGVTVDTVIATSGRWDSTHWTIDRLPVGQSETLTLILSTVGATPGEVTSVANLDSVQETDLDDSNDSSEESSTIAVVEQGVDIVIAQTQSATNVEPGASVVYTITATNDGTLPASDLVIQNLTELPAGVTIGESDTSAGDYVGTVWLLDALPAGASETLTLNLVVGATTTPGSDVISNTAQVLFMQESDMDPSNNTSMQSTSVTGTVGSEQSEFELHISRKSWETESWQLSAPGEGGNRVLPWLSLDTLKVNYDSQTTGAPLLSLDKVDSDESVTVEMFAWDGLVAEFDFEPLTIGHYRASVGDKTYEFSVLPADSNANSVVDLIDFSVLSFTFGQTSTDEPLLADYNGDGVVNLVDFSILSFTFGTELPPLPPPVIQPTSAEIHAATVLAYTQSVDQVFASDDEEELVTSPRL